MTVNVHVHYWSTVRGITQGTSEEDIVYFGKAFTIPAEAYVSPEGHVKHEVEPETLLQDRADWEPVPDGVLERYEVRDSDTEDVVVLYRMPFRKKRQS